MLIAANKKNLFTTAAFKPHAFGEPAEGSAQVAVVDIFAGDNATSHSLRILDALPQAKDKNTAESRAAENLPFNAVVAVSPGTYNVELGDSNEPAVATASLNAGQASNYVVMRVGGLGETPEEVVVFPIL